MKSKLALFLVILLVGTALLGCSSTSKTDSEVAEKATWRFVHEEIEGSVQDMYAQKFKELIEAKSDGRITVEVYPVGQLGDGVGQVELLQNGGVEFAINNPGSTGTIVPENQLFSLHFILSDDMDVNQKVMREGKSIKKLNKMYLDKGMKVLDWFTEGFQMWTGNKALKTPEDLKGFKMRTMASPMIVAAYEAYDANPTPVPYMEVYSSLQLKMIDGQVNPIFAIQEMKFYEVQSHLMLSKQNTFVGTFCANPDFWEGLSDKDKKMVESIIPELNDYIFNAQEKLNSDRLEMIKEASDIEIIELTDEERAKLKEASMSAREVYIERAGEKGKEILELLDEDVKNFEGEK